MLNFNQYIFCRLFKQYLLLLFVNQMASALFRLIAALGRNMIVANTCGAFALLVLFALGGFVLSKGTIDKFIKKEKIFFSLTAETNLRFFSLHFTMPQMILRNGGFGVSGLPL